jgi:hypothetical protein
MHPKSRPVPTLQDATSDVEDPVIAALSLKKLLLVQRRTYAELVDSVLVALRELDPAASLLEAPEAWARRDLVASLWNALPEEDAAYRFESEEVLTREGAVVLEGGPGESVVLHLGWETFCVRTTLEAAWYGWPRFCRASTEAYNACVYPDSLSWYVVRAGTNLYPMDCRGGSSPHLRVHSF